MGMAVLCADDALHLLYVYIAVLIISGGGDRARTLPISLENWEIEKRKATRGRVCRARWLRLKHQRITVRSIKDSAFAMQGVASVLVGGWLGAFRACNPNAPFFRRRSCRSSRSGCGWPCPSVPSPSHRPIDRSIDANPHPFLRIVIWLDDQIRSSEPGGIDRWLRMDGCQTAVGYRIGS